MPHRRPATRDRCETIDLLAATALSRERCRAMPNRVAARGSQPTDTLKPQPYERSATLKKSLIQLTYAMDALFDRTCFILRLGTGGT